jgi:transposase
MPVKTDRIDARNIAWALQAGWYRTVHVKSRNTHKLRALLRSRAMLVKTRTTLDNHRRGILKAFGLKVGRVAVGRFEDRVRGLISDIAVLEEAAEETHGWAPIGDRLIHHAPAGCWNTQESVRPFVYE